MKKILLVLLTLPLCAQTKYTATVNLASVTFANLGTPSDGSIVYCSDCTSANPTAGGGTGAVVRRENGAWNGGGSGGAGGGTVTSVTCNSGLTGGVITTTGTCAVDTTANFTWTGNHDFSGAASVSLTTPFLRNDVNKTFNSGKGLTFTTSISLYSLILAGASVPTTLTAGGVGMDSTGHLFSQDGTNVQYHARFTGSGSTAPGAISTGKCLEAGSDYNIVVDATNTPCGGSPLTTGTSVTLSGATQYFTCTSTCTVTVPVPSAGVQYCVFNDDNVSTVITLSAIGSSARYENTARTAYGTAGTGTAVSGGAVKDSICIVGRDSTHYFTLSSNGTWTMN